VALPDVLVVVVQRRPRIAGQHHVVGDLIHAPTPVLAQLLCDLYNADASLIGMRSPVKARRPRPGAPGRWRSPPRPAASRGRLRGCRSAGRSMGYLDAPALWSSVRPRKTTTRRQASAASAPRYRRGKLSLAK